MGFQLQLKAQNSKFKTDMQLPAHRDPSLRPNADISSGILQNVVPAFRLIDEDLVQVKRLIEEQLIGAREPVSRFVEYLNSRRGKMIRPGLVLLSYRVVRDKSCETKKQTAAIRVAAIIELIHNATLLHDDVIDGGQQRRGQPTVNSVWGNESAVLLGDYLLSKVFKMCADLEQRIIDMVAATAARVCEGEMRQVSESQNWRLSESEYIDIITEKSAALFSSCCSLGGLLAGANEMQSQSLGDFGLNTGIAFQITDDLLDIIGDESKVGKTLGSDVVKNKLTLPLIHLLRTVDEKQKSAVIYSYLVNSEACLERDSRCENESLANILERSGSLEYSRRRVQEFIAKALQALTDFKDSEAKSALIETAKFIGQRTI